MNHWVAAWGTSPSLADVQPAQYAKNITLRYKLTLTVRGTAIRLRFDNLFNEEPAELTRVTVCTPDAQTTVPVLFNGNETGIIPAKGSLTSIVSLLQRLNRVELRHRQQLHALGQLATQTLNFALY